MIELSGAWLGTNRALLEAMPHVAPLLPDLQQAHDALVAAVTAAADDGGVGELTDQITECDTLYRRLARGILGLLTAVSDLADDAADKQRFGALKTVMFPRGASIVTKSYLDEAGQAALVEASLTDDQKKQLKAIPTPHGSLFAISRAWFKAARELGELTQKRAGITDQPKAATGTLLQRNAWVRIVKAIVSMIELDAPPADVLATIEGPLHLALANATPKKKANPEPEPPAPTPTGATNPALPTTSDKK